MKGGASNRVAAEPPSIPQGFPRLPRREAACEFVEGDDAAARQIGFNRLEARLGRRIELKVEVHKRDERLGVIPQIGRHGFGHVPLQQGATLQMRKRIEPTAHLQ